MVSVYIKKLKTKQNYARSFCGVKHNLRNVFWKNTATGSTGFFTPWCAIIAAQLIICFISQVSFMSYQKI